MPTNLGRMLAATFKPATPRRPDIYRKEREEAKRMAATCGCTIERDGAGWNVWPPKEMTEAVDPFSGDHYCQDWSEVLDAVRLYHAHVRAA
jgi:hypothetical protein